MVMCSKKEWAVWLIMGYIAARETVTTSNSHIAEQRNAVPMNRSSHFLDLSGKVLQLGVKILSCSL